MGGVTRENRNVGNGEIGGQDVFALTFCFRKNFWFRELGIFWVGKLTNSFN